MNGDRVRCLYIKQGKVRLKRLKMMFTRETRKILDDKFSSCHVKPIFAKKNAI